MNVNIGNLDFISTTPPHTLMHRYSFHNILHSHIHYHSYNYHAAINSSITAYIRENETSWRTYSFTNVHITAVLNGYLALVGACSQRCYVLIHYDALLYSKNKVRRCISRIPSRLRFRSQSICYGQGTLEWVARSQLYLVGRYVTF